MVSKLEWSPLAMPSDHLRAPPAFQQYASDLLANEHYRLMTLPERGLLEALRLQSWVSGSVPYDCGLLSRLTGIPEDQISENLTSRVLTFFEPNSSGRLVCPELVRQRARMEERRVERSRSGKRGAKAKWDKEKRGIAEPMAEPSSPAMTAPEKSREALSGEELSKKAASREASLGSLPSASLRPGSREWVDEYNKSEAQSAEAYRKASRG